MTHKSFCALLCTSVHGTTADTNKVQKIFGIWHNHLFSTRMWHIIHFVEQLPSKPWMLKGFRTFQSLRFWNITIWETSVSMLPRRDPQNIKLSKMNDNGWHAWNSRTPIAAHKYSNYISPCISTKCSNARTCLLFMLLLTIVWKMHVTALRKAGCYDNTRSLKQLIISLWWHDEDLR